MSKFIIPFIIIFIIVYGLIKKVDIYNAFLEGVKEGIKLIYYITPAIFAFVIATTIFMRGNIFKLINFHFPLEIVMLGILRPISGNAALSIVNIIFQNYGPDSFFGLLASIINGATDTTLYVLALYFGSIRIKKTRYALPVGLFADFIGIVTAFLIANFIFK